MLVLFTNRKSHTGFPSVPKLMTLNDLERRNGRYFVLFHLFAWVWANYIKVVEA